MFVTALLLGLVGVFCILDSRILGRMNFERPLITCTIVGALLGDLQTGLTLGASIELMSLGIVNIGAAAPPDMNMAAIICAAFAILTDASAETALALAIPIAVLGQMLGVLMRTILSNLTHVADHAIAEGKFRKAWSMHIVWGTVLYSLMYFIPIFLSVYFGTDLVQKIVAFIPAWLTDALTTVVDAKDYGLGNAVDSSVITYFNPMMHTAVFRVYAEELSYVRQHPLTLRRYMWKLEY